MAAHTFQSEVRSVRTSGLEIYGVAKGLDSVGQIVQWARDGKLIVAVERTALSEIETAWQRTIIKGRRIVIIPQNDHIPSCRCGCNAYPVGADNPIQAVHLEFPFETRGGQRLSVRSWT